MIPKEHTKHESFIEARTSKIIFNKTLSTWTHAKSRGIMRDEIKRA
jgi:hypothetical protein